VHRSTEILPRNHIALYSFFIFIGGVYGTEKYTSRQDARLF